MASGTSELRARSERKSVSKTPIIERAIQLAKGGACKDIPDLERKLAAEGYASISAYLSGSSLRKQLRQLMKSHSI